MRRHALAWIPPRGKAMRDPSRGVVIHGGRRFGKASIMKDIVKAELATGRPVWLLTGGEAVPIVGVVDDPNTRLIEDKGTTP